MKRFIQVSVLAGIAWGCTYVRLPSGLSQEATQQSSTETPKEIPRSSTAKSKQAQYETEFADYLTGSKLTGVFTIDGRPLDNLESETYEIKSAKKIEGFDHLWEIVCRIQYGEKDIEVPIEIDIFWVGKTPMMVLDSVTVPGMGTFSARVLFHDKKYTGTWKHDEKGGHVLGRVERKAP